MKPFRDLAPVKLPMKLENEFERASTEGNKKGVVCTTPSIVLDLPGKEDLFLFLEINVLLYNRIILLDLKPLGCVPLVL